MGERHPRMIVSTEGAEGCGKTHFALSAPRPITYLDFDYGVEGVGEADTHKKYNLLETAFGEDAVTKRHAQREMQRFLKDFMEAIGKARTVVADTFTAAWAGQRFARSEDRYVEIEEEFRALIRAAYAGERTNVILIHHLRPDFKRDTTGKAYKAGTYSRDGMDGVANMVQLAIRQRFIQPRQIAPGMVEPGRFETDVLKSRDNIGLVGQTFPSMDFPTLCAMVCPTIDWSK